MELLGLNEAGLDTFVRTQMQLPPRDGGAGLSQTKVAMTFARLASTAVRTAGSSSTKTEARCS